jgi:hypothetical protein
VIPPFCFLCKGKLAAGEGEGVALEGACYTLGSGVGRKYAVEPLVTQAVRASADAEQLTPALALTCVRIAAGRPSASNVSNGLPLLHGRPDTRGR